MQSAEGQPGLVPRIRSIPPDACDDDVIAATSTYAFRTWVFLWTHLDDMGRGVDSAKLWAGKLYSLNDKMTEDRVEKDLSELEERGLLIRYEVDGKRYLACAPAYWSWQKPQHPTPSKLPPVPPPEDFVSAAGAAPSGVEGSEGGVEKEGESEGEVSDAALARAMRALALGDKAAQRLLSEAESAAEMLTKDASK